MATPITLEIFTDYVRPWCYLSTVRSGSSVSPRILPFVITLFSREKPAIRSFHHVPCCSIPPSLVANW